MTAAADRPSRVLVVDDDDTIRILASEALSIEGFEVTEAEDGHQALRAIEDAPPDIVLLDMLMPGLDGFGVLSALRECPATERLPVVVLTGLEDSSAVRRAFDAGATDFASKPVNWMILCERIRFVLRAAAASEALRRAREEALEAARLKAEFVRNVSHEIRTPLNGVMGLAHALIAAPLDMESATNARLLVSASEQLLRIVNDILDFSKLEAGKVRMSPEVFSAQTLFDTIVATTRPRAAGKGLELRFTMAPRACVDLDCDVGRLRQIVFNLLDNAVKFTERGYVTLNVDLEPTGDETGMLLVAITDTGIGVDTDKLSVIFTPFAQADGSTTRRFGGSGLGLSISSQLARLMGGSLEIKSTLGVGSTFTARVGVRRATTSPLAAMSCPEADGPRASRPLNVLVAEDHPINQRVIAQLLKLFGHKATVVGDGRQAVDALVHGSFDLVLMDIQMPVLDGYGATAEIRAREARLGGHTPIIALTAHAIDGYRETCLAAGMDDYIAKPIQPAELERSLARVAAGLVPA